MVVTNKEVKSGEEQTEGHISDKIAEKLSIPSLSFILAIISSAFILIIMDYDPIYVLTYLIQTTLTEPNNLAEALSNATPLIFTGLSVAIAFRAGMFNIGTEGQVLFGGFLATFVGFKLDDLGLGSLPFFITIPLLLVAGMLGGAIWAFIPAYLKAKRGVHEVITTIMMNYVAYTLMVFLAGSVDSPFIDKDFTIGGNPQPETPAITESAIIPRIFDVTVSQLTYGIFIAIIASLAIYIVLWHTNFGYEIRSVGFNKTASKYGGINVSRNLIMTLLLSGALGGLGGAVYIMGSQSHRFKWTTTHPGYGFDGIAVALLGGNHPIGVLFGAILFGWLQTGGQVLQGINVPKEIASAIQALIVFFVAIPLLSKNIKNYIVKEIKPVKTKYQNIFPHKESTLKYKIRNLKYDHFFSIFSLLGLIGIISIIAIEENLVNQLTIDNQLIVLFLSMIFLFVIYNILSIKEKIKVEDYDNQTLKENKNLKEYIIEYRELMMLFALVLFYYFSSTMIVSYFEEMIIGFTAIIIFLIILKILINNKTFLNNLIDKIDLILLVLVGIIGTYSVIVFETYVNQSYSGDIFLKSIILSSLIIILVIMYQLFSITSVILLHQTNLSIFKLVLKYIVNLKDLLLIFSSLLFLYDIPLIVRIYAGSSTDSETIKESATVGVFGFITVVLIIVLALEIVAYLRNRSVQNIQKNKIAIKGGIEEDDNFNLSDSKFNKLISNPFNQMTAIAVITMILMTLADGIEINIVGYSNLGALIAAISLLVLLTMYLKYYRDKKLVIKSSSSVFYSNTLFYITAISFSFLSLVIINDLYPVLLFRQTLTIGVPIGYCALGGMYSEKSGVVNIGLEGMMLSGAFVAVAATDITGNPWIGVSATIVAGVFMGLLHAIASIKFRADQVVVGVAINLLASGLTTLGLVFIWNSHGNSDPVSSLPDLNLNILKEIPIFNLIFDIPFIGELSSELLEILGGFSPLIYIFILLVVLSHWIINKTAFGLRVRSVGEHPRAADTLGINVYKVRYISVILSGILAALGGAQLTLGTVSLFGKGMTTGRGFIGLAALIFGGWTPIGAALASFIFSFSSALIGQLDVSSFTIANLPIFKLAPAVPYLFTLIMVAIVAKGMRAPAADGIPYIKEDK